VTLDSIAARHPDRADRLAARSESARALAARIRQQFPVSRHAAVPARRSRPPAPQPDAVPASPARRVTPLPGLAAPRGAAPDLPARARLRRVR
jgi:hypothetical protein